MSVIKHLLPIGSKQRGVLEVGSIPLAILPSSQYNEKKFSALISKSNTYNQFNCGEETEQTKVEQMRHMLYIASLGCETMVSLPNPR